MKKHIKKTGIEYFVWLAGHIERQKKYDKQFENGGFVTIKSRGHTYIMKNL